MTTEQKDALMKLAIEQGFGPVEFVSTLTFHVLVGTQEGKRRALVLPRKDAEEAEEVAVLAVHQMLAHALAKRSRLGYEKTCELIAFPSVKKLGT